MLIGIDASRATSQTPTGTETYSRELIRALVADDSTHRFRLYTREAVPNKWFGSSGNFEVCAIPFPRLWTHLRLSAEMLTRTPDILFVPAHVLPPIHPVRSVVTIHDLGHLHFPEAHPARQRLYHAIATRWNAQSAVHILADSEATRDDIIQFCGVRREKISVVYPAIDQRLYKPVTDKEIVEQARTRFRIGIHYILAIGTIHPRKNYTRLVEAFSKISNRDCQLVIAGKRGWLYKEIFDRIAQLKLDSRVRFLDYVPNDDLLVLLSGARALAFPSLHEGFGLPVLEAQACGTPVVCSMTSSLPEAAGDGALFVDPCDPDAIAGALDRVLNDDAITNKIRANGFRNLDRFSWQKSASQVRQVFESI